MEVREEEIRSASSGSKIDLDGSRRHGKEDAGEGQGKEGGREGRKGGREDRTSPSSWLLVASCTCGHVPLTHGRWVGKVGTVGGTPDTALRRRRCCCQEVCLFHGRILLYLTSVLERYFTSVG